MSKIDEAIFVLGQLGLPKEQVNERSGLTLLALVDLHEDTPWSQAKIRNIRIHDILLYIQFRYNKHYAENTRETIRRQTIHQFEQAGIVERNADEPLRSTYSP
jgi:adenine-specific DNA-methyltransferase